MGIESFDEIGESRIDGVDKGFEDKKAKEYSVQQSAPMLSSEEKRKHLDSSSFELPDGERDDGGDVEIYTRNKEGQKDGPAVKTWSLNGEPRSVVAKTFYKDGVEEGPFKIYRNGHLAQEGTHKQGKLDGILKKYDSHGLSGIIEYKDGLTMEEVRQMEAQKREHEAYKKDFDITDEDMRLASDFDKKFEEAYGTSTETEKEKQKQEQAKEKVQAETGYSAEALAAVGKEVLKAHDGVEKQDIAQAADGIRQTSNNAVKDMLSKMTDGKVAEDIVKAGLGSEHLSTSVGGLEAGAKAMQETLEASETSQKSMYERIKDASDMTNYPQLRAKHQEKSVDNGVPLPQIPGRDFKVEKPKPQSLSPDILKNAAKKAAADR